MTISVKKFHTKTTRNFLFHQCSFFIFSETRTKSSVEGVGADMGLSIYSIHQQLLTQIDKNLTDLAPECLSQLALSVNIQFKRISWEKYQWANLGFYAAPSFVKPRR